MVKQEHPGGLIDTYFVPLARGQTEHAKPDLGASDCRSGGIVIVSQTTYNASISKHVPCEARNNPARTVTIASCITSQSGLALGQEP